MWIEDFLCNQKQWIGVNGCFSQWYTVCSGIPQGSILKPILFLIFINDLPAEICYRTEYCCVFICWIADDAKVYNTITCDKDHLHLQKVIDHIKEWCDQWLLPLNINKMFPRVVYFQTKHIYCIPHQQYIFSQQYTKSWSN